MTETVIMYAPAKLCEGNLTGGAKRYIELYNGLKKSGFNVILFSGDEAEKLRQLGDQNRSIGRVGRSRFFWMPTMVKSFIKNFKIIKEIKNMKYDSLIVFDVPTAINFCVFRTQKIDLFVRQDLISYKYISVRERTRNKTVQKIYLKAMKMAELICLRRARKIIVQCEYDKNELYKRHPRLEKAFDSKMIVQINNVNPAWIVDKSKSGNSYKKSSKIKICFIGDFNGERKGHRIFLGAIKKITDKGHEIEAVLIGGGKKIETYKQLFKGYSNIQFLGRLENPIKTLKECDLLVVPSLADSCPNTVMEALYNEIPVIGSNSGGIPEILNNPGALFETSISSLQNKLEYYLIEENLAKLKEQQKIRKQELSFDWPSAVINHLELR